MGGGTLRVLVGHTCHPAGDLNRTHPVLAARGNKAPLIGREETGARCRRGGCVSSAQGQMRLPRESSACSSAAASPARPRGRHSFLHLVGELLLVRGYRLGEDRGSTGGGGWRINLHWEGESQDAPNTHAGADLALATQNS